MQTADSRLPRTKKQYLQSRTLHKFLSALAGLLQARVGGAGRVLQHRNPRGSDCNMAAACPGSCVWLWPAVCGVKSGCMSVHNWLAVMCCSGWGDPPACTRPTTHQEVPRINASVHARRCAFSKLPHTCCACCRLPQGPNYQHHTLYFNILTAEANCSCNYMYIFKGLTCQQTVKHADHSQLQPSSQTSTESGLHATTRLHSADHPGSFASGKWCCANTLAFRKARPNIAKWLRCNFAAQLLGQPRHTMALARAMSICSTPHVILV